MKLHDGGRAPNPRRVRMSRAEKGVSVSLVALDIERLEHTREAFTALDPLQPREQARREQALVKMWSRRLEFDLLVHVVNVLRHPSSAMAHLEVPQVVEVADASRRRVEELLSRLDTELSGRTFVPGGDFGTADITSLLAIDLMKPAKLAVHERLSNLARWHASLKARAGAGA